ncbi:MAG: hypothetical protein ACREVK_12740 [Gammaproteobacteria bacterium]
MGATVHRTRRNILSYGEEIRQLMKVLTHAGLHEIQGGGKGSHRKFTLYDIQVL